MCTKSQNSSAFIAPPSGRKLAMTETALLSLQATAKNRRDTLPRDERALQLQANRTQKSSHRIQVAEDVTSMDERF